MGWGGESKRLARPVSESWADSAPRRIQGWTEIRNNYPAIIELKPCCCITSLGVSQDFGVADGNSGSFVECCCAMVPSFDF